VGVTDTHRLKFAARFLLHGNSLLHPLRTLQSHHLSDVLSSPDRVHLMLRIRKQNRGTNRNGSIDEETSYVCEFQTESRINLASLHATLGSVDSLHINSLLLASKGCLTKAI